MTDELRIDAQLLVELGEPRNGPCVSMFLPSVGAGVESRQDAVRIRQMVLRAEELLTEGGMRREEARRMLARAAEAGDAGGPWEPKNSGMAVFVAPSETHLLRFQSSVVETVHVGPRFVIRPMLPDLAMKKNVLVLAVSRGSARLLRESGNRMEEIDVPGIPPSLDAATQYEDPERQVQFRSASGTEGGAIFYGHGGRRDRAEELTREYARRVWQAAERHIGNRQDTVLILAAPPELIGDFSKLGTAPDDTIEGAPERMQGADLAEKVRLAAQSVAGKQLLDAISRFNEIAATRRAARQVREVLPASHHGRVGELFMAADADVQGQFDRATGEIEESAVNSPETDDLLDLAAHFTLKNGGRVHVLPLTDMPGGAESGPIAAILRG